VVVALLCGLAASRLARPLAWRVAIGTAAVLLPLLTMPDAPRALRATMQPVHYPADWTWAAADVGHGGAVAVLPFQPYRLFPWAPGRSVIDPAGRLLPGAVVVSDRLAVSGRVLAGEDQRAARVAHALASGSLMSERLAAEGIGWVLVERTTPGQVPDLGGLELVRAGDELALYRVPSLARVAGPGGAAVVAVLVADVIAAALVLIAAGLCLWERTSCYSAVASRRKG
jgi:hypothetical protein